MISNFSICISLTTAQFLIRMHSTTLVLVLCGVKVSAPPPHPRATVGVILFTIGLLWKQHCVTCYVLCILSSLQSSWRWHPACRETDSWLAWWWSVCLLPDSLCRVLYRIRRGPSGEDSPCAKWLGGGCLSVLLACRKYLWGRDEGGLGTPRGVTGFSELLCSWD